MRVLVRVQRKTQRLYRFDCNKRANRSRPCAQASQLSRRTSSQPGLCRAAAFFQESRAKNRRLPIFFPRTCLEKRKATGLFLLFPGCFFMNMLKIGTFQHPTKFVKFAPKWAWASKMSNIINRIFQEFTEICKIKQKYAMFEIRAAIKLEGVVTCLQETHFQMEPIALAAAAGSSVMQRERSLPCYE